MCITTDDGSCVFAAGCDTCSGETDGSGTVIDNPEEGEACDDGNADTVDDAINANCVCAGTPIGPQNDVCADAFDVLADVVTTDSIAPDTGGAVNNCFTGATDAAWYSYTALTAGETTVSSSIDLDTPDTRVSIYTGTCDALTCLASDDDSGEGFTSIATFTAVAGETYLIEWDDRWGENPFDFVITVASEVPGCTDATACNFDANATVDDTSCVFATGCDECDGAGGVTDNPEAGEACDDGDAMTIDDVIGADCVCAGTAVISGCTDATACNFNAEASQDDLSCVFATGCDVCDGAGGVTDNPEVGDACDDGDVNTINDIVGADCVCAGESAFPCNPGMGLEDVIVEKYYISDANDATDADGGSLPVGSTTYRVYLDLAPGWRVETIFGSADHDLTMSTTTAFFNNEDRGEVLGENIGANRLDENTVALDSYLTIGAAADGYWGVLKDSDADGSIVGGINNDGGSAAIAGGLMVNQDAEAGIPLTTADGLLAGTPPTTTIIGDITAQAGAVFGDVNAAGPLVVMDGAYAVLGGTEGPTAENRVLIAQVTTDGVFSFRLNFRIQHPMFGLEQYVPDNPLLVTGGTDEFMETQCDLLDWSSGDLAVVPQSFDGAVLSALSSYPNPNNGISTTVSMIDMPGDGEMVYMELVDMFGRTSTLESFVNYEEQVNRPIEFERQLVEGMYFIRVQYNGTYQIHKFNVSP